MLVALKICALLLSSISILLWTHGSYVAAFISLSSLSGDVKRSKVHVMPTDDIDIPIIFENDKLIAINKPPHVPHHDNPSTRQLGIMSLIRAQQHEQSNPRFRYPHRLWSVHRLDQVTSGILIFAKDSATASTLIGKFQRKEIKKYYTAVSGKKATKKKQGWVKGHMKLGRRGSYKLVNDYGNKKDTTKKTNGYAVTRFFTAGLGNLSMAPSLVHSLNNEEDKDHTPSLIPKTAVLFEPHSGKTHQLRVAAKSLAIPILGDLRYGGGCLNIIHDGDESTERGVDWNRTYLHASAIHFQLDEHNISIWSPPECFDHLFTGREMTNVFVKLMEKHCDCTPILDVIHKKQTPSNS